MSSGIASSQGIVMMKYAQAMEPSRVPYYKHSFGTSTKGKKDATKQILKDAMVEGLEKDVNGAFDTVSSSAIETGFSRIYIDCVVAVEQAEEDDAKLDAVNFFDMLKISYKVKGGKTKKEIEERKEEVDAFNTTALPIMKDIVSAKKRHYQRLKEGEKKIP
jgi:hypothetical protein